MKEGPLAMIEILFCFATARPTSAADAALLIRRTINVSVRAASLARGTSLECPAGSFLSILPF